MVATEPKRGAVEHYYRATSKVYVPSWVAALWPKSVRGRLSASILEEIEADLVESIKAGLLADRLDEVMSRDSRTLDGQAREDVEEAAAEFYKRFEKAGIETDERLRNGEGDGKRIQTTAARHGVQFAERPKSKSEAQQIAPACRSLMKLTLKCATF